MMDVVAQAVLYAEQARHFQDNGFLFEASMVRNAWRTFYRELSNMNHASLSDVIGAFRDKYWGLTT